MTSSRVIVFTCNWHAFHGLEAAGSMHSSLPPGIFTLKVACLGQISPGIVMKAFEHGASGVLLLGCLPEECHYEFGSRRAQEIFQETKNLAVLIGLRDEQLQLDWVPAGDGQGALEKLLSFIARLNGKGTG